MGRHVANKFQKATVLDFLRESRLPYTCLEVAEATGLTANEVRSALICLEMDGRISHVRNGTKAGLWWYQ